jgi:hypothetical protein
VSAEIDQEQGLRILDNALWRIAHERGECYYADHSDKDKPKPCDCPRCVALAALAASKSWRFQGSHYERTQQGGWPREAKMQSAWAKYASQHRDPDVLLSQILGDDRAPSARDWYVATSVVQWLATNCGMTILEAAGFKYAQWDEDRAEADRERRREAVEAKP